MLTIILLTIMFTSEVTYVQAARKKVDTTNTYSIAEFTANLLQAMDIDVKKGSYLEKAKEIGLYKTKEINEKNKKITKAEASILVNRADEYLYHDTYKIAKDFLKKVQYTAVPDIGTLGETRRISCSNAFAKGIIPTEVPKLFSNTSKFHPGYVVTKDEANVIISRTVDPTKRFKVTPEGAMCKENNTIERQDKFVSVLASVPDDFYSGKLSFEKNSRWGTKEFGFKEIDKNINGGVMADGKVFNVCIVLSNLLIQ